MGTDSSCRLHWKCNGTRAETRCSLSVKRTSPFKSAGASVQSTTGSRGVRISGTNAGYNMFRSSVKGTGYTLHSPVSPSFHLPCVTVCHHISTGLYRKPTHSNLYLSPDHITLPPTYSALFQCWCTQPGFFVTRNAFMMSWSSSRPLSENMVMVTNRYDGPSNQRLEPPSRKRRPLRSLFFHISRRHNGWLSSILAK